MISHILGAELAREHESLQGANVYETWFSIFHFLLWVCCSAHKRASEIEDFYHLNQWQYLIGIFKETILRQVPMRHRFIYLFYLTKFMVHIKKQLNWH